MGYLVGSATAGLERMNDMSRRKKKSLIAAATEYVEAAAEQTREFVHDTAVPALAHAQSTAQQAAQQAAVKAAASARETAQERALPALVHAREQVQATAGPALAQARKQARAAAAEAADAAVAKVRPAPVRKKRRGRALLVAGGVALAVAAVVKLRSGGGENWQSAEVPARPSTPAPTAPAPTTPVDDVAGASPDEAVADAVEAPHSVTTPDDPATVVDVEEK